MELKQVLRELMLLEGISGYEKNVAHAFQSFLTPYCESIDIDPAGNVIGKISGAEKTRKLMIFAHLDSLGFIVRKIESNGLLQIDRLGGIPEKVLPALQVSVIGIDGKTLPGVIAVKSHHATDQDEKYKAAPVTSLFIDIGAAGKQQVLDAGVHVGCPVVYKPSYLELMNSIVCGTTVDNRGGCAALVRIAELLADNPPKAEVYIVGTVWEEFNLRGAMLAARRIRPDFAICLDVTLAGDTPDTSGKFDNRLGGGPAVALYNFHGRGTLNGTIAHRGLYRLALACAEEEKIPLQEFSALGMLTDNAYVQFENEYVACLDMGFPVRYAHSPIECCDICDLENLSRLVSAMTRKIDGAFSKHRYE